MTDTSNTSTDEVRPGDNWTNKMIAEEPTAREQWPAGEAFEPHDGQTTDANILYADLLAGPDENHPDPMAGWTPTGDTNESGDSS